MVNFRHSISAVDSHDTTPAEIQAFAELRRKPSPDRYQLQPLFNAADVSVIIFNLRNEAAKVKQVEKTTMPTISWQARRRFLLIAQQRCRVLLVSERQYRRNHRNTGGVGNSSAGKAKPVAKPPRAGQEPAAHTCRDAKVGADARSKFGANAMKLSALSSHQRLLTSRRIGKLERMSSDRKVKPTVRESSCRTVI